jgi:hypothetical protein
MTGMSRHLVSFCKAATTAKPSISGIIRSSRIASGLSGVYRKVRFGRTGDEARRLGAFGDTLVAPGKLAEAVQAYRDGVTIVGA